jgi:tRNA(fMet)-specific endonuclease VapC
MVVLFSKDNADDLFLIALENSPTNSSSPSCRQGKKTPQLRSELNYDLHISSITASELYFGVHNSPTPKKLAVLLANFLVGVPVVDYAATAGDSYGRIRTDLKRRNKIIGELDMLIAAHAKSLNLILVTNNTDEFQRVGGLTIEDWKCAYQQ